MPLLPRPLPQWPEKDPGEVLDYALNFQPLFDSNPAAPTNDAIQTIAWTVPAGLTQHDPMFSGMVAVVWLSGGLSGAHYLVSCRAVSQQGRVGILAAELPVRLRKAI